MAARQPVVFVVRHGETEWSRAGRHTSYTDIPLTEHGQAQAKAAGYILDQLSADGTVFTSPRLRARDTARLAGHPTAKIHADLTEWNYGSYEGLTSAEIQEAVPGWTVWTHDCPGGESAIQVDDRASRLLQQVQEILLTRNVVLFSHGHFSRVIIAKWLGLHASGGVHFRLDTAGITTLGFERGVPQIRQLNIFTLGKK